MAITTNDYFLKTGNPGTATTLSAPGYTVGATSINVASTSNFPTGTAVIFGIDTASTASGSQVRNSGTYCVFIGIVTSATSIGSLQLLYGTPQNYAASALTRVYITVSSLHNERLINGILQQHKQDGSHAAVTADSVTIGGTNVMTLTPTGAVLPYAGAAAPTGWLLCNGAAISRSTYSSLFTAIGTVYGTGDGTTTFNVPDLRGRVAVGVGTATGAAGATAHTLGQKAGEETHVLTTTEMPSHTHSVDRTDAAYGATTASPGYGGNVLVSPGGATTQASTRSTGNDGAHNNMQPYVGLTYIIKT